MLPLEVCDKFLHLIRAQASLLKHFTEGLRKAVIDKEGSKSFSGHHMGWTCWQSQVYLFLHMLRCPCSLHLLGLSSSRLSSEEYSITTFLSNLPPGLGSDFGLPFPLPIASGFPPLLFRAVCLVRAMQKGDLISRFYDIRSVSGQRVPLFFYTGELIT